MPCALSPPGHEPLLWARAEMAFGSHTPMPRPCLTHAQQRNPEHTPMGARAEPPQSKLPNHLSPKAWGLLSSRGWGDSSKPQQVMGCRRLLIPLQSPEPFGQGATGCGCGVPECQHCPRTSHSLCPTSALQHCQEIVICHHFLASFQCSTYLAVSLCRCVGKSWGGSPGPSRGHRHVLLPSQGWAPSGTDQETSPAPSRAAPEAPGHPSTPRASPGAPNEPLLKNLSGLRLLGEASGILALALDREGCWWFSLWLSP